MFHQLQARGSCGITLEPLAGSFTAPEKNERSWEAARGGNIDKTQSGPLWEESAQSCRFCRLQFLLFKPTAGKKFRSRIVVTSGLAFLSPVGFAPVAVINSFIRGSG